MYCATRHKHAPEGCRPTAIDKFIIITINERGINNYFYLGFDAFRLRRISPTRVTKQQTIQMKTIP